MKQYLSDNKEWIFSGIGVSLTVTVIAVVEFVFKNVNKKWIIYGILISLLVLELAYLLILLCRKRYVKKFLAKLPSISSDLFGRDKELNILDTAWENDQTNIVSLVAFGGVGKTALVNKWLLQMGKNKYRGAEKVYGWSFYSQGAAEGKQASADLFIASALKWFDDPNPDESSPWSKGERLAELVKKQRTLLILDGLEPLQYPPGEMKGQLKEPGLQCLLRELAHHNPGLCIITTRLPVVDLKDFVGTSLESVDLEYLSLEAGTQLLEKLGVKGTADELKEAVDEFDGHALALTLLGRYLAVVYNGDVRQRDKIASLTKEPQQGGHAKRVMESYERWFKDKPELNILRIMGLFDRPVEGGAIDALKARPAIEGLTSELQELSYADWQFALNNLRTARLLAEKDPNEPDTLDCHPLIREHFGEKLKESNPGAWKEAHSRLYEFYKSQAKEFPDTLEEMAPLYAAVAHGCRAGRHQEALEKVYQPRILRIPGEDEFYSTYKLGAFGAELAARSGFFESPWEELVAGLTESAKAFIMRQTGYCLRALGYLAESTQCMQAALNGHTAGEDWKDAAIDAAILTNLYLYGGHLGKALAYAQQGVGLADRSDDTLYKLHNRWVLVNVLHLAGRVKEAEALFHETEELPQAEEDTLYPVFYSYSLFDQCDMLLDNGKCKEAQILIKKKQSIVISVQDSRSRFAIARNQLSLGQILLAQIQQAATGDFSRAAAYLEQAVADVRQSGRQDNLPLGLLARAELYRVRGEFKLAQRDLEEAMFIATRIGMGLHQADCHLECCRLLLAMVEAGDTLDAEDVAPDSPFALYDAVNRPLYAAREHLAQAKTMVDEMGYHRRATEVLLETTYLQLLEGNKESARQTLTEAKTLIDEMGCHRWDIEAEANWRINNE